jgi:hypothetical protein
MKSKNEVPDHVARKLAMSYPPLSPLEVVELLEKIKEVDQQGRVWKLHELSMAKHELATINLRRAISTIIELQRQVINLKKESHGCPP